MTSIIGRTLDIALDVGLWVVSAASISLVVIAAMFYATGLRPVVITSGSMSPSIPVGSLVIAEKIPTDEAQVGDVVTVAISSTRQVTHRVVESLVADNRTQLILQGDANPTPDATPVTTAHVHRMENMVPSIGMIFVQLRTPLAIAITGGALGVLGLIIASRVRTKLSKDTPVVVLPSLGQDLRTPLTSIVGYSELLSDGSIGALDPAQLKAIRTVQRNADTLAQLVRSIP